MRFFIFLAFLTTITTGSAFSQVTTMEVSLLDGAFKHYDHIHIKLSHFLSYANPATYKIYYGVPKNPLSDEELSTEKTQRKKYFQDTLQPVIERYIDGFLDGPGLEDGEVNTISVTPVPEPDSTGLNEEEKSISDKVSKKQAELFDWLVKETDSSKGPFTRKALASLMVHVCQTYFDFLLDLE